MNQTESVLRSFAYTLDYLTAQVADLDADEMVLQSEIVKNHPAWVLGHLAASCQATGRELGLTPWLPENWGSRFGYGSQPTGKASDYQSKQDLLAILLDARNRICDKVRAMSNEELAEALPDEDYHDQLPTKRDAVVQLLVAHTAYHVGQVVIWRRSIGKPALDRPFL